jgi:hypothetical protein
MMSESPLLTQHSKLKLQIELIPYNCWYTNVRSNVLVKQWNRIRKEVYQKANNICEICGGKGFKHPVECHEIWIFDDEKLIQKLDKFQALCPLCHEVKHIGLANVRGKGQRALGRFIEINRLDIDTAIEISKAVFLQWEARSSKQWVLDIELLKSYGII